MAGVERARRSKLARTKKSNNSKNKGRLTKTIDVQDNEKDRRTAPERSPRYLGARRNTTNIDPTAPIVNPKRPSIREQ